MYNAFVILLELSSVGSAVLVTVASLLDVTSSDCDSIVAIVANNKLS
jgi:hypothetical protein